MPVLPIVDSIIGANKLLGLQRTYMWDVFMPFSMGWIPGELLCKYCQDVKFGDYGMGEVAKMRGGAYQKFFAGMLDISSVTMVFLKPLPDVVSSFFYGWKDKMIDSRGFYSVKNAYCRSIYVLLSNTTNIPSSRFRLLNAFPKTFPSYDLAYSSEDVVKFTIEFSVDGIERMGMVESFTSLAGGLVKRAGDLGRMGGSIAKKVSSFF